MIQGKQNSDCEALLKAERILRDLPKVYRDGAEVLRIGRAHRESLKLIARVCPDGTDLLAKSATVAIPTPAPTLAETNITPQSAQPEPTADVFSPSPQEERPTQRTRKSVRPPTLPQTPVSAPPLTKEIERPARGYTVHADRMAITGMRLYAGWTFNIIGYIVSMAAWIWLSVLAYKESGWWFLGVICFSSCIVTPIFIAMYWKKTWPPALLWLSGFISVLISELLVPGILGES